MISHYNPNHLNLPLKECSQKQLIIMKLKRNNKTQNPKNFLKHYKKNVLELQSQR